MIQGKIRLGFDAKRAYCNHRGLGTYSRLLIESLAQWASPQCELYLMTPNVTLSGMENWPNHLYPQTVIKRLMPEGIAKFWPEYWRGYSQIKTWEECGLHLYHGLSHDLPWSLRSNGNNHKVKSLVTIHDLIFMRQPELYPWWDRPVYLKKVKHSCHIANSIIAISEQAKLDLLEFLEVPEEKIKVIYQAVHPRYYRREVANQAMVKNSTESQVLSENNKQYPLKRPYFLFVGAFEERKNILRLIQAFSIVKAKVADFQLVLIGRGGLIKEITSLITSLKLNESITILNNISSEELPQFYQNAHGVVYPSLLEGFGLPIVEAMMSETLVLTSQGSCFPEAGGDAAFYANPLDIEELAGRMLELIHLNSEERKNRIEKGWQYVQKFHWKNTSKELLNHYQSILS